MGGRVYVEEGQLPCKLETSYSATHIRDQIHSVGIVWDRKRKIYSGDLDINMKVRLTLKLGSDTHLAQKVLY